MPKVGGDFFWCLCEAPAFDTLSGDEELGLKSPGKKGTIVFKVGRNEGRRRTDILLKWK